MERSHEAVKNSGSVWKALRNHRLWIVIWARAECRSKVTIWKVGSVSNWEILRVGGISGENRVRAGAVGCDSNFQPTNHVDLSVGGA